MTQILTALKIYSPREKLKRRLQNNLNGQKKAGPKKKKKLLKIKHDEPSKFRHVESCQNMSTMDLTHTISSMSELVTVCKTLF